MKAKRKTWTVEHFSQANLSGPKQADVPLLLRRVAGSLEALGAVDVQDITFHTEVTADGPWHSITVYFDRARPPNVQKAKREKSGSAKRRAAQQSVPADRGGRRRSR